jgi:hypothetical protein
MIGRRPIEQHHCSQYQQDPQPPSGIIVKRVTAIRCSVPVSTEPGPSIGIVAVFGEYSIVGGKGYVMSIDNGFRWVEVAEPRKSLLSKAIIISDDAPSASTS